MLKDKENWTRICPKCKSSKVVHRGAISKDAYSPNYVCLTCGFQSPLFPEVTDDIAKELPTDQKQNFVQSRLPIFADNAKGFNIKAAGIIGFIIFMIIILLLLRG